MTVMKQWKLFVIVRYVWCLIYVDFCICIKFTLSLLSDRDLQCSVVTINIEYYFKQEISSGCYKKQRLPDSRCEEALVAKQESGSGRRGRAAVAAPRPPPSVWPVVGGGGHKKWISWRVVEWSGIAGLVGLAACFCKHRLGAQSRRPRALLSTKEIRQPGRECRHHHCTVHTSQGGP